MATALTVDYSVGDTVYVTYPFPDSLYFTPTSRVVSKIELTAAADVATVSFTSGNQVVDSDATQRVYLTETLAATAIVSDVITRSAAAVALDSTTSIVSTAGQASTTLGRIG